MSKNAELARQQLERHSIDRYVSLERQYMKLVTEVGELGDELLNPGEYDNDRLSAEAADVAICLYHLAAKLGFDLDEAIEQLVEQDDRKF